MEERMELVEIYAVQGINLRRAKTIKIPKYEYETIRDLIVETLRVENESFTGAADNNRITKIKRQPPGRPIKLADHTSQKRS